MFVEGQDDSPQLSRGPEAVERRVAASVGC